MLPMYYSGDWFDDGEPNPATTRVVLEADSTSVFVGLVDSTGRPLFRVREQVKIGFHGKQR